MRLSIHISQRERISYGNGGATEKVRLEIVEYINTVQTRTA